MTCEGGGQLCTLYIHVCLSSIWRSPKTCVVALVEKIRPRFGYLRS